MKSIIDGKHGGEGRDLAIGMKTKATGRGSRAGAATRRGFCVSIAAGVGAFCFGGCRAIPCKSGASYRVALLGDTHYDREPESLYHSHYDESNKWAAVQHAEFRRNGEMWRERCPSLVKASASLAKKRKTAFVLQMGDLVQGDCDDAPTHRKMLDDAIDAIRGPYPAGLPFLTVVGNHDIRGKGAKEEYKRYMETFMPREVLSLGVPGLSVMPEGVAAFTFNGDRWIFCDFESKKLEPLVEAVENSRDARHVFLVTHGPFVTPDTGGGYRWRLAGSAGCDSVRPRLCEALSRRRAIVLAGHTHTTCFCRIENEYGGFTELTANSVWADPLFANGEAVCETPAGYGRQALDNGRIKPEKIADYKSQLDFFRPSLKEYEFLGRAAGHYDLEISDGGVCASFYPGAATAAARKFKLDA